jgi:hypothetical protein
VIFAGAAKLSAVAATGNMPAHAGAPGVRMLSPDMVAAAQPMHPLSSRFIAYPSYAGYRSAVRHFRLEVMDNAQLSRVIGDSPGD